MTDIWEVKTWNTIEAVFPKEWTESRVLLTAHKLNVAKFAYLDPYGLQLLSFEYS